MGEAVQPANADLLAPDEPHPLEVLNRDADSDFLLICEHAGRRIPRALGTLGLGRGGPAAAHRLGHRRPGRRDGAVGPAARAALHAAVLAAGLRLQSPARCALVCAGAQRGDGDPRQPGPQRGGAGPPGAGDLPSVPCRDRRGPGRPARGGAAHGPGDPPQLHPRFPRDRRGRGRSAFSTTATGPLRPASPTGCRPTPASASG